VNRGEGAVTLGYGLIRGLPVASPARGAAAFRGDLKNGYNLFQRDRFDRFVAEQYVAGRLLREIGELTGRTQTAVRASLDRTGTPRRAQRVSEGARDGGWHDLVAARGRVRGHAPRSEQGLRATYGPAEGARRLLDNQRVGASMPIGS
jgi:hypothetical protein